MGGFYQLYNQDRPDFQDYFSNYSNNYAPQDRNYFFSPEDAEQYTNLASKPPASKNFIEDYLSRRPQLEDYKPSFGRKLLAFALGTLSGPNAYQNAQRVRMDPFNNQMEDWKAEGTNLASRASALDKAQANELKALEFGLTQKAKAANSARLDRSRGMNGATSYARGATQSDIADLGLLLRGEIEKNRQNQIDWNNAFRTEQQRSLQDYREETLGLRERALQDKENNPGARGRTSITTDPVNIEKQTIASRNLALQEIAQDPQSQVFTPIIEHMRAARANNEDPMAAMEDAPVDPSILRLFKQVLQSKINTYMIRRR